MNQRSTTPDRQMDVPDSRTRRSPEEWYCAWTARHADPVPSQFPLDVDLRWGCRVESTGNIVSRQAPPPHSTVHITHRAVWKTMDPWTQIWAVHRDRLWGDHPKILLHLTATDPRLQHFDQLGCSSILRGDSSISVFKASYFNSGALFLDQQVEFGQYRSDTLCNFTGSSPLFSLISGYPSAVWPLQSFRWYCSMLETKGTGAIQYLYPKRTVHCQCKCISSLRLITHLSQIIETVIYRFQNYSQKQAGTNHGKESWISLCFCQVPLCSQTCSVYYYIPYVSLWFCCKFPFLFVFCKL